MRRFVAASLVLLAGCGQCQCNAIPVGVVKLDVVDAANGKAVQGSPSFVVDGQNLPSYQYRCLEPSDFSLYCSTWGFDLVGKHSIVIQISGYVPQTIDVDTGTRQYGCCSGYDHMVEAKVSLVPS
jgi:hypothetical protein